MTQTITIEEAHLKIQQGTAILIDVREADEFQKQHIPYALSIPLSTLEDGFKMLSIPADKTILFQCLKGSRGQIACQKIKNLSSQNTTIMNLDGGIEAWKNAGFPVIDSSIKTSKISIMRQVQMIVGFLIALSVLLGFNGFPVGFIIAGFFGFALLFAGISGWCGLALILSKMAWNK